MSSYQHDHTTERETALLVINVYCVTSTFFLFAILVSLRVLLIGVRP